MGCNKTGLKRRFCKCWFSSGFFQGHPPAIVEKSFVLLTFVALCATPQFVTARLVAWQSNICFCVCLVQTLNHSSKQTRRRRLKELRAKRQIRARVFSLVPRLRLFVSILFCLTLSRHYAQDIWSSEVQAQLEAATLAYQPNQSQTPIWFWTSCVRSEKLQNEGFPNFLNFRPEFYPEFCSEIFPNFSRIFRASFRGRRRTEKINQKCLPFFNAQFPGKHEKNIHKIVLESGQSNLLMLRFRAGFQANRIRSGLKTDRKPLHIS